MSNYKEASKEKIRFETKRGSLTVEQLWTLPIEELDELCVSLEEQHKTSAKKSFVHKKSDKDKMARLRFEVALDVLESRMEELEKAAEVEENKKHNERIMELIVEKKDEELKGKSVKQLTAMLK